METERRSSSMNSHQNFPVRFEVECFRRLAQTRFSIGKLHKRCVNVAVHGNS